MNTSEATPLLSVQSLGNLHITFGGRAITLKMSKAAALLVYLMRHGDLIHGRERLAILLWPEESETKTRENFRQALYQIRRVFGDRATADRFVTVTRETVQFHADSPHTLDANLFEQSVRAGAWDVALDLYAGEFLATFYPTDAQELGEWQSITRERLHQLVVHACTRLAGQLEKRDPARAADVARRLLDLEPWAEEGHRLLMRWWAAQGQPAEALAQYQRCVTILADELGIPPATETTALYEQIRGDRLAPLPSLTHNLPALLTPLVGRRQELSDLEQLLFKTDTDASNRLITLVGPGGVGKTKLMVALGWAIVHHPPAIPFTHIFFISFAELEADGASHLTERITAHLLTTLDIQPSPNASYRTILAERWKDRPVLLLLDNWEHLTSAAGLLNTWLAEMPRLRIVVTSREPLGIYGEILFRVSGLETETVKTEPPEAGRFFVQSARRVQPRFQWDKSTAPLIQRICAAVDGHPLALEMAAAWLQGLSLAEVAEGVADGLDLLTSAHADTPARQRDMRHILAQSWQKLTSDQQRMLAQLSLFRQAFTPALAQAVAGASRLQLALVVAHFWLRRGDDGRYHFHELLRHFAREQRIAQPSLHEEARRAYIREHLRYLQRQQALLEENPSDELLRGLRLRHADLEQAWIWAVGEEWLAEIITTVGPFSRFYTGPGLPSEGIRLLDETIRHLRQLPPTPLGQRALAHVLITQARLRNRQVKCERIPEAMAEAIELAQSLSDQTLLSRAYREYGAALGTMGRLAESRDLLRKGLVLAEAEQNWEQAAEIYLALGNIDFDEGLFIDSMNYYHQAIKWYEALNKPVQRNHIRHNLAICLAHLGQYDRARRLHQQNLASWRTLHQGSDLGMCLEGLGYVALAQNRLRIAGLHLRAALRIYTEIDDLDGVAYTHLYLGHMAVARGRLADAATHYRAMIAARQGLGQTYLLNQGWAGLAEVAWQRGEWHEALAYVDKCWSAIVAGQIQGEEPMPAYLTCYRVLSSLGDERATVVLEQALSQLNRQIQALGDDEPARQAFIHAVPSHRALRVAADQQGREAS